MDEPKMNGAESVVRSLHGAGVDVCFANPGTSEMQFVDALDRTRLMRCVLGLFEGVVTGAADGYARMAGKPAVSLLHLAPGLANGGANLHNAKKARTPMLTLVGDHAVDHLQYDAPLTADVAGAARPFADYVDTARSAESFAGQAMEALAKATGHPGQGAVLIAPADLGWAPGGVVAAPLAPSEPTPVDERVLDSAVRALEGDGRSVIIAGNTVLETPEATALLQGIAEKTGAEIIAPTSNRRMERGGARAEIPRLPYAIDLALDRLAGFTRAILIEAQPPVAFFAYPKRPSLLLPEGCEIVALANFDGDGPAAVRALAERIGARPSSGPPRQLPDAPGSEPITPESIAAAVGNALPEGAIVVDESVTSGRMLGPATAAAPEMSWIALTGGAIGSGLPMATGASVACPDRPVVVMQADGSAMYTIQSLWTQAREGLNVTTVVFANRSYEILKGELRAVGSNPGPDALAMLNLDRPTLDFCAIARGMGVAARRVETAADLARAIKECTAEPGPSVIEAVFQS